MNLHNHNKLKNSLSFNSRSARNARDGFDKVHNEPRHNTEQLPDASSIASKSSQIGLDIRIDGLRVESADREPNYDEDGVPEIMSDTRVRFRFFGSGFSNRTVVTLTEEKNVRGGSCMMTASGQYRALENSVESHTMVVDMVVPRGKTNFFFCTKNKEEDSGTTEVSFICHYNLIV